MNIKVRLNPAAADADNGLGIGNQSIRVPRFQLFEQVFEWSDMVFQQQEFGRRLRQMNRHRYATAKTAAGRKLGCPLEERLPHRVGCMRAESGETRRPWWMLAQPGIGVDKSSLGT